MNVYRFILEINKNNKDSYKYLVVLYSTGIRCKENFLNNKSLSVQFFPACFGRAWFYCHTGLLLHNIVFHSVEYEQGREV